MLRDNTIGTTKMAGVAVRKEFLHLAIYLAPDRVLDDRVFRLSGFSGQESVSNPFEFQLQLHANTDEWNGKTLTFGEIIGRPVTFAVRRPALSGASPQPFAQTLASSPADRFSYFNGIATGFSMAEPGVYNLSVKAAIWKLNLSNGYEIHSQLNIRDVIAKLLDRHKVAHDMSAVEGDDNLAVGRIQDWMQAGESDYAFLQRLMSKAHLYYYFVHGPTSHTVVFANSATYRDVFDDKRRLRYTHTSAEELGLEQDDIITQYSYEETLTSSGVNGIFTRQENTWEEDPVAHYTSYQQTRPDPQGALPFHQYKVYQYGCDDGEVERFTNATASSLATSSSQLSGGSRCDRFRTGYCFSMTGPMGKESYPNPVRPSLEGKRFVITQVQHQASLDGNYQNTFQATEDTGLITPFSLQETHQGSLLAKVIAVNEKVPHSNSWEYVYKTDFELAQQTYKDRSTGSELNAKGVYVQFSTSSGPSAPIFVKLAPHMQTVPEIGVMVWVSRANDESELPEIQSIVHSNGNKVVMPSGWTANTQVGNNFSTAYSDSMSVRFGWRSNVDPGKVDAAEQKVEGAYRTGKFKDVSYSQGGGYSYSTSESGRSGLLSESESHGNTYSHQYADESKNWSDVGFSYSESVAGKTESHSTVKQDSLGYQIIGGRSYNESTIGTSESVSTIQGNSDNRSTILGDSNSHSTIMGKNNNFTTVVGKSVSNTVMSDTTNTTLISGDSTNVNISAGNVIGVSSTMGNSINLSTQIGPSINMSVANTQMQSSTTAMSVGDNTTGMSVNQSMTGLSTSTNLVGISSNTSIQGLGNDISVNGSTQRMSVTGRSIDMSLTGTALSVSLGGVGAEISIKAGTFEYKNPGMELDMPTALKMVL